jgi:hypothetical protein
VKRAAARGCAAPLVERECRQRRRALTDDADKENYGAIPRFSCEFEISLSLQQVDPFRT